MSFEVWVVEKKVPCAEGGNEWIRVDCFLNEPFKEYIKEHPNCRVRRYIPQVAPGWGSLKGGSFERDIGWYISKWLSHGKRTNLCRRTILSGGQYTQGLKSGEINPNPGDLTSNDPLAFPFFEQCVIECKHWKWIELIDFIWGKKGLYEAMLKVQGEALAVHKMWLLIFKQNSSSTMILLPNHSSGYLRFPDGVEYHLLFKGTVYLIRMDDLFKSFTPEFFIEIASKNHD